MGNYRVSPEAKNDLYEIWLYGLDNWGLDRADSYYDAFYKRFEELAKNPYLYQAVEHIREGYRASVCGADTIYYRVAGDTVEIMNVLGQQNRNKLLSGDF